jgi:hypothetical protein
MEFLNGHHLVDFVDKRLRLKKNALAKQLGCSASVFSRTEPPDINVSVWYDKIFSFDNEKSAVKNSEVIKETKCSLLEGLIDYLEKAGLRGTVYICEKYKEPKDYEKIIKELLTRANVRPDVKIKTGDFEPYEIQYGEEIVMVKDATEDAYYKKLMRDYIEEF